MMYKIVKPTYLIYAIITLTATLFAACSDVLSDQLPDAQPGTLTLYLAIGAETDAATRAEEADVTSDTDDGKSPATPEERTIHDLRYFAFPQNDKGKLLKGWLTPPTTDESANEQYKEYTIKDVQPGTYRIYLVANMPETYKINTEEELKQVILTYHSDHLPQPGNLPMVYEPAETETVEISTTTNTTVETHLRFTCVKVRYNLIFDPEDDEMTETLKNSGLMVTSVNALQLSSQTPLIQPLAPSEGESFEASLPEGTYYASFTRRTSLTGNGEDVIQDLSGNPATYGSKWIYQSTVYLPERYVNENSQQSYLSIQARMVDKELTFGSTTSSGSTNTYRIPLGHITETASEVRQFPRGTYYEIIATIRHPHITAYDTQVNVNDWTPVKMNAMGHTILIVNKTEARVTSIQADSIVYDTNQSSVKLGSDITVNVDDKQVPLIIEQKHNEATRTISFCINPEIPIERFGSNEEMIPLNGTIQIWIEAGNIRKYLNVNYEAIQFFEVEPIETQINWLQNEATSDTYTRTFRYQTNLGGIAFLFGNESATSADRVVKELLNGTSRIKVVCDSPTKAVGTFTVTALNDPKTSTLHQFQVQPLATGHETLAKEVSVRVKPPLGDYRICFRAINDRSSGNGLKETFSGILSEGSLNNWEDGWKSHFLYCYTQMGETIGDNIPEYYVWRFTGEWPGATMSQDMNNTGWYCYNIKTDAEASNTTSIKDDTGNAIGTTTSTKKIKPGETLLMFTDRGASSTRHRCTHHLDPGIQLFDYEDREGWILYDPLCDPYYSVYDVRPEISDISYIIYSNKYITRWYSKYGSLQNMANGGLYELGGTPEFTKWKDGSDKIWYKTILELKAPENNYVKNITLDFADGGNSVILNGGANFYPDSQNRIFSTYENGMWQQGEPEELTEISTKKTIYVKTDWYSPRLWAWTDSNTSIADKWENRPEMENVGNGWWKLDINIVYTNLIITDNNGTKCVEGGKSPSTTENQYFCTDDGTWPNQTEQRPNIE